MVSYQTAGEWENAERGGRSLYQYTILVFSSRTWLK